MWETLVRAASLPWLIVGAAALGGLAAVAALIALPRSPRATFWLAGAAIVFSMGSASVGAVGAWRAHSTVAATRVFEPDFLSAAERRRLRRAYLQARAPARLALLACAAPLVSGAVLMFVAARRRAALASPMADPDVSFAPRAKLGVPVVLSLAGALVAAIPASVFFDRIPAPGARASEAALRLDADLAGVHEADEHQAIVAVCASLEDDLDAHADAPEPSLAAGLSSAARRCVEELIQSALLNQRVEGIRSQLRELKRSALVESDPALLALIESTDAEVAKLSSATPLSAD